MPAYLLLVLAVLSRLALAATPHPEWFNFTAVGGALLFFGARRSWREMLAPLAVLMATDYFLTTAVYGYPFRWQWYALTWAWYLMAMALGHILLHARTSFVRVAAGVVLGPTSFFIASNYAVWFAGDMYPRTANGLATCYAAALPFYRNDLIATTLVAGLAFGLPVLLRRLNNAQAHTASGQIAAASSPIPAKRNWLPRVSLLRPGKSSTHPRHDKLIADSRPLSTPSAYAASSATTRQTPAQPARSRSA